MTPYISLNNVAFGYEHTGFALHGISLDLHQGQTVVITGQNGSGKSTLAALMMGLIKPHSGTIRYRGSDGKSISLPNKAKSIGYGFQNPDKQFFCLSALEEIAFSLRQTGQYEAAAIDNAHRLLGCFGMQHKADSLPQKLSDGEKRRLALLAVFALDRPYYILDEPTAGLDVNSRQMLFDWLAGYKQRGTGLCIITHDEALIRELGDKTVRMSNGRLL